jgi:tetratricopeptide (TPR) repeat protein
LIPYNPQVWFLSGQFELQTGNWEAAWRHWRRSLECSNEYQAEILAEAGKYLEPGQMAEQILPDNPALLWSVWESWEDRGEDVRRPLLERALALLARRPLPLSNPDLLLKARTLEQLGRPEAALAAVEELVDRAPDQVSWRLELAQLLVKQGRLEQARRELRLILFLQPNHGTAQALQREVVDRLVESKKTRSQ